MRVVKTQAIGIEMVVLRFCVCNGSIYLKRKLLLFESVEHTFIFSVLVTASSDGFEA